MPFSKKSRTSGVRYIFKSIIDNLIYLESRFCRKDPSSPNGKKRVLILRKDGLGDCIIFYPTLAAYREYYRDDEITLVFPKVFESLFPLLNSIDKIIWFDANKFSGNLFYRRRFLLDLHRKNYDVVLYPVFTRETMGDFMVKISCAKETVGFDGKDNSIYGRLITPPKDMNLEIDRDRYFAEMVTNKKIDIAFPTIDIKKLPAERSKEIIQRYSLDEKPFVIVFPGAGKPYKIWQPDKFAAVIDYLIENNMTPVVCGDKKETTLAKDIISQVRSPDKVVDISGQTDLPTMAHLLARAKFYFGSDTSILHLATAIKTPTLCIMGGGHFGRFFPYGDLTCNKIVFDENMTCMNDDWACTKNIKAGDSAPCIGSIKVEKVKMAINDMIHLAKS
jgi:ADP-heptose:LPS heptosyltransferase